MQKSKDFHKNMCKKIYDFQRPHLNLTMLQLRVEEPQLKTKTQNKTTYTPANTQIQNTTSPNLQQDYTHIHNQPYQ